MIYTILSQYPGRGSSGLRGKFKQSKRFGEEIFEDDLFRGKISPLPKFPREGKILIGNFNQREMKYFIFSG